MIIILALALLFAGFIAMFVLQPLTTAANQSSFAYSHRGFADEQELRSVLELRDAALHKIVFGNSQHPALAGLNKESCFEVLVSLSLRLQRAELPFLPEKVLEKEPEYAALKPLESNKSTSAQTQMPSASTVLSVVLAGLLLAVASLHSTKALAQAQPPASSLQIPPAFVSDKNTWVPQVSQFVLSPRMGELHVFYLGVFANPQGVPQARISLPIPSGFQNLKLLNLPNAVLGETSDGMPVFESAVGTGITEIRAEFDLDATFGKMHWENPQIPSMPGTMLLLLPEYDGLIHAAFETLMPDFNFWPTRIAGTPSDFRSSRAQEQYDPNDPNAELFSKMPPQYTRQLVRSTAVPRPYPAFEVVGIVPSRTPLYVLVVLVGALLFSVAVYTIIQVGRQKNPVLASKA